jgi:photosystem I subunit X
LEIPIGEKNLINSALLLAVKGAPTTSEWSPSVAIIMILCNLLAIFIGYYAISKDNRGKGAQIPGLPALFTGFGVSELLATASLGHILGAGVILALGNSGIL